MFRWLAVSISLFASSAVAQNASLDQATWDLLESLVKKRFPNGMLFDVQEVRLYNVVLAPDLAVRSAGFTEPTTSQIFNALNCSPRDQEWERDIDYNTKAVTEVFMTETVTTTNKVEIEAKASLFGVVDSKVNYTFEKKVEVSKKERQEFTAEREVRIRERRTIPKDTRLYVRVVEKSEVISTPMSGTGIVDAKLRVRVPSPFKYVSDSFWLSSAGILPQPKDRSVDLAGVATTVIVESIDVIYEEKAVSPNDPACFVFGPPALSSFAER